VSGRGRIKDFGPLLDLLSSTVRQVAETTDKIDRAPAVTLFSGGDGPVEVTRDARRREDAA